MRKLVTVRWGGDVIEARTFPAAAIVTAGDGASDAFALPVPSITLPASGALAIGALEIEVTAITDAPPPRTRPRAWSRSATLASAVLHVGALAALALFARVHAPDPAEERAAQLQLLQGYMGRIGEHDALAPGDVANDEANDALAFDRGAGGGDATREDPSGAEDDAAGRALADRTPSLAPLVYVPNEPQLGAHANAARASSPSTLAPKLSVIPRARSGSKGLGGGGGGGPKGGGGSNCVAFAQSPQHDPTKSTWIEFRLEDTSGNPVPNQRWRVTLPDGQVQEGLTDARGLVCLTGVAPGDAKIEWIGASTRYVGSSPTPI